MTNSEFAELTEKELKYELFRALRRHESERAIAILKDSRVDANWQHGYKGRSVLMQAFFEKDEEVFMYLLSRPEIDAKLQDDDGHTIYYWLRILPQGSKINFKTELIRAKGNGPKSEMEQEDYGAIEYDEAFYEKESFSLYLNRRYKLLDNFREMKKNHIITYIGTHTEPAERWHDTYHDFEHESGKITSIPSWKMPQNLRESHHVFEDVLDDLSGIPAEAHKYIHALKDRSSKIRLEAATSINPDIPGLEHIMSIILEIALRRSDIENPYIDALVRIGDKGLSFVEGGTAGRIASENSLRQFERILAKLGSTKNLKKHYETLKNGDQFAIRFAIKQLRELDDLNAIPHLKELLNNENYNVRTDAKKAMARILRFSH